MSERPKTPYYFEKPEAAVPLNPFERAALKAYRLSMEFSGPNQTTKSDHAKKSFDTLMEDIAIGNPFSHPLHLERERTYSDYDIQLVGAEHIPQQGSFVVVSNHYNRGVHKGINQPPVMSYAISQHLPDSDSRKFIPVIEGTKSLVSKTEKNTGLNKVYPHMPQSAAASLKAVTSKLVTPIDQAAAHILLNTSIAVGMIPTETHTREIIKIFKNGDVLVLFPTGKDEFAMHQVNPMAGKLAKMAGIHGAPILPVGYWFSRKNGQYRIKIGEPFIVVRDKTNEKPDEEIGDLIGTRIALLLPTRMRGYYESSTGTIVKNQ